jgi:2-amino-4-hydroxy-6-hydroxymethyldihydropteridine diphosphokinase
LEKREGRKRNPDKNAPRTLDVDLVDWRGKSIPDRRRPLPRPDIREKAYALFPFLEIAPGWTDPVTGLTLVELAARFKGKSQKIRRLLNHGVHGV